MLLLASGARLRAGFIMAAVLGLALLGFVATPAARAATPGTFTTLASSPNPINAVVTDPTTGLIYGRATQTDINNNPGTGFYRYDPATNSWTTLASAPTPMDDNGGGAYLDGKIYVSDSEVSTMDVYDIATNTWTSMPNPSGGGTAAITSVGDLIYVAAGPNFVSYNPVTGTKTTLAAPPFVFTGWGNLDPYNGKIYASQGDGSDLFAVYDIASNTWKSLPDEPNGTGVGAAVDPVTGTLYTYGPYGGGTFDIYDIATGAWTTRAFPYSPLNDGGMAYVGTPGLQGVYATYTEESDGFTRYNTVAGADVSVKKSASARTVALGNKFTYTLRVKNTGASSATGVTVTDKLPAAVKFSKDKTSAGKCKGKTTVTCSLGTLAAGKSATVKITVTARKLGKTKNTATVSTTSFNANLTTSSSVTVKITARKLKLSVTPHSAAAGVRTCYAFTGTSGGKRVAKAKVSLSGHSATTSSTGHATLCLALKKGTYHARISKTGYSSATAAIRVTAAPSFTG